MARRSQPKPEAAPRPRPKAKGSGLVLGGVPRVNLLPTSELQRRAAGALIRRWAAGMAATALVVSGLVAAAYWGRGLAEQQLAAEQARTTDLNVELGSLSHVSRALTEQNTLSDLRTKAMGNDIEWRALFSELTGALPKGAELTGFDLVTGANPTPDPDPTTGIGVLGQLIVTTTDPSDQNRMVDRLRALDISLAADAGVLSAAEGDTYTFVVEIVIDQTHYSGRHLPEAGAR